jgi:hypothetical protein
MTTINYTFACAFMSSTYTRVVDFGHNLSLKKAHFDVYENRIILEYIQ